jgi:membrane protein DedA with SNARE-associated domain
MAAHMSVHQLLSTYGYLAVFLVVGVEYTGVPFPGETMLIAAAIYAASGHLQIGTVMVAAAIGATLGGNIGYFIGRRFGRALLLRYGRYLHVDEQKLLLAERFFARHGDKTVVIGRFITLLRAWASFLAGVNSMPLAKFQVFNAFGSIVWAGLYGYLAFTLGEKFPLQRIGIAGVLVLAVAIAVLFILHRRGLNLGRLLLGDGREGQAEEVQVTT